MMTAGSSILAIILTSPPHLSQFLTSMLNTRFNRFAQVIESLFSAGICPGWPAPPGTQASTPERSGTAMSFRAGDVRILLRSLALVGGHCVKAIPWFKQILKVFVCGLRGEPRVQLNRGENRFVTDAENSCSSNDLRFQTEAQTILIAFSILLPFLSGSNEVEV